MSPQVKWQIRRVRLIRVGPPSARFLDVTLDLTDDAGHPLDTILWLRNGGGKSTVLSLVCALIRPHRRDFLATSATDKHLEDYVLGADTAHVTVEWSGPDGRRLVTGAVYEWTDRVQPADPNRDHDKLNQRWYVFTPVDGRAEQDLLPYIADGRQTPLKDFIAAVRAWNVIPGCSAAVTDSQDRWGRMLDEHGLDPDLFTAILQMNSTEGGIEGQFQFRNPDQFVRYLLELITDPESPRQVSAILEDVRAGLAERPALIADLTFADEAVPLLRELDATRTAHSDAVDALREAETAAGRLRAALAAAATLAGREVDLHAGVARDQQQRQIAEGRAAEAAYSRSVELRRIAATHRLNAANTARAGVAAAHEQAKAVMAAWRAVPRLHALKATRQRVRTLQAQLDAATSDAEPLRRARDDAAAIYAAALEAAIADLDAQVETLRELHATQEAAAEEEKARWQRHAGERGTLDGRLDTLTAMLHDLDEELATAVAAGTVHAGEGLTAAVDRHRAADATAEAELADVSRSRDELNARREELTGEQQELKVEQASAGQLRAQAATRRDELAERIDDLAGAERLRLLAETDDVDVLAEGADLARMLSEAIVRADKRRVELAVEGAEDDRAYAALTTSGLLPPTLDVARALDELEREEIAATTGWAYLADSVPATVRAGVILAAPALAGGVLIHDPDELAPARQLLTAAGLRPTSAVGVATTADLQAVVDDVIADATAAGTFVVPPAAALIDRAAAGDEIQLRDIARAERNDRIEQVAAEQRADTELRRRLLDLLDGCPPGTLEGLDAQITDLDTRLAGIKTRLEAITAERKALTDAETALERRRKAAEQARREAASAISTLTGLADRMQAAAPLRAEAAALPRQIAALTDAMNLAAERERDARGQSQQANARATSLATLLTTRRGERGTLDHPAATDAAGVPLAEAKQRWEVADAAYRRETSDSELAGQLEEAQRAVTAPSDEVAALSADLRVAAEALYATAEGGDPTARAAATSRAEQTVSGLDDKLRACDVEISLSKKEVADHTPADRPRRTTLEGPEPATREEALAAAEAAEAERDAHRETEREAQAKTTAAAERRQAAATRAEGMSTLVELLGGDQTTGTDADTPPFVGSVDEGRTAVTAVRARIKAATDNANKLGKAVDEVSRRIMVWATDDRFAAVKADVRGRFRVADVSDELGPVAATLADDLEVYAANLRGRLDELEAHKATVVTAMVGMVRQALRAVGRAQALSELPDTLGPWAGQRFLEVGPRASVDTSDAILRDRCSRLVDSLTARGVEVPRGLELLWQATSAVVGDGNWKARVLKPSPTFAVDRVSVEKMRKWSGGEKVTISLLLFCMVAKLRATNRGRSLPGLGVLPLDNPLGKANYVVFLDLQRKVATANGVQLLFLTGVGDMRAVGRFPNIIRLRNTRNGNREYVRIAERRMSDDDPAGVVDNTRVWRDDPVLKLL